MSKAPLWSSQFIALSVINFLSFFGFQMIVPALPLHLHALGAASHHVGFVLASFTLTVLMTRPLTGLWLDQGRDRLCVILGIIICVVATGAYWLAPSVLLLTAARMVHGSGFGISSVSYGTIVTRLIPANRRGEGMGYFGLSLSLALCLGPWAGTAIMARWGFGMVLIVSGICVLLAIVMVPSLPKAPAKVEGHQKKKLSWSNFFEKSVWFPALLCVFLGTAYGAVIAFITLWGKTLGLMDVGAFFLVNAGFSFIVRLVAGKVSDRLGYGYIIVPGCFLQIIGLFLLGNAVDMQSLLLSAACLGLGLGAVLPVLQAWSVDLAPVERRGAAMACFYNAYDVGIGGGIIVWGLIASEVGYGNMYFFSTGSIFLLLISYLIYGVRLKKRKRHLAGNNGGNPAKSDTQENS